MSRLEPEPAGSRSQLEAPSTRPRRQNADTTSRGRQWWRNALGLFFLAITVCLWTTSNFLSSTIFADDTYSKPFFVTYLNTGAFVFMLLPPFLHSAFRNLRGEKSWLSRLRQRLTPGVRYSAVKRTDDEDENGSIHTSLSETEDDDPNDVSYYAALSASQELLLGDTARRNHDLSTEPLSLTATARLSLEFCLLWFTANYAVGACLQYTTVASSTILSSTSSIFTLIFGVASGVERFTLRKLLGVIASLAGIILISSIDMSGSSSDDEHRGDFPSKTPAELTLGNGLALLSAILYGVYAVFMKHRIPDEERVNMPVFLGFVGLINVVLLSPGLLLLHLTRVEPFELPPTSHVILILFSNAFISLISDVTWAYAVILTSPIVVTVGLSLTIPLSLIGQIILNHQTAGLWYWLGALVIVFSFVFVQQNEQADDAQPLTAESLGSEHDD